MPRDGSKTRDRILDAAERLVIEHGYSATPVDEVIARSSSSKGAFFHHFPTKRALADALVERYVTADLDALAAGLEAALASSEDPGERVVAFVAHYEEQGDAVMTQQSGCLYTAILTERQLVTDGASEPITRAVTTWRDAFAALLRDALPDEADLDVGDLADHLFVTFEGAFLLARSTGEPALMRAQLRVLRQLLERVLGVVQPARV